MYYIVISLFYDCEEMLCSCLGVCLVIVYCLVFMSTPVCKNGAGRHRYICSLFCLGQLVKSCCQVCAFMWTFCLTADFCPLPHLEAEQVIFLETAAFCPLPIERPSSSPEYLESIINLIFEPSLCL